MTSVKTQDAAILDDLPPFLKLSFLQYFGAATN